MQRLLLGALGVASCYFAILIGLMVLRVTAVLSVLWLQDLWHRAPKPCVSQQHMLPKQGGVAYQVACKCPSGCDPQLAMNEPSAKPNPDPQHLSGKPGVPGIRRTTWLSGRALSTRVHEWGMFSSGLVQRSLLLSLH